MNDQNNNQNNNFFNQNPILSFLLLALVLFLAVRYFAPSFTDGGSVNVSYSQFKELISSGKMAQVGIGQTSVQGVTIDGQKLSVQKVQGDATLVPLLDEKKVPYTAYREGNWLTDILGWVLPIVLFFVIWFFLSSRMTRGAGIFGSGGTKKLINSEKPTVKFADVAGVEEAKEEVKEIVDFLRTPERYIALGAKIPKGVLLVGPPGTGKTLLAKAVAGEADVPFFSMSGSSFIEMFVGVGASRVRELFEVAKKEAPAIVFIDEIDAIGKSRAAGGMVGGNDEREQTINALLAEMDGFASDKSPVIVLAATNRPEVLDAALLRPGRFDRQVVVDRPDFRGRLEILKVHVKGVKLAPNSNLDEIAKITVGLAGADLANIINEAALLAGRNEKTQIEQSDLLEAVERATIGLAKKTKRISQKEKKITAYHESGHALIAEITRGAMRVSKVTIVPRGFAGGYTLHSPEDDKSYWQRHELIAQVDCLLAGRAAEDVFIGEISTGASNDLERATDIIKAMIGKYGMSDVAGLMVLSKESSLFLGGGQSVKDYSDETARDIDKFVKGYLGERYAAVKGLLGEYGGAIEKMVARLFEDETVEGEEIRGIIAAFEKENGLESRLVEHGDEAGETGASGDADAGAGASGAGAVKSAGGGGAGVGENRAGDGGAAGA